MWRYRQIHLVVSFQFFLAKLLAGNPFSTWVLNAAIWPTTPLRFRGIFINIYIFINIKSLRDKNEDDKQIRLALSHHYKHHTVY